MGVISDFREGKRGDSFGFPIVFWGIVGAFAGVAVAATMGAEFWDGMLLFALTVAGSVIGIAIGLFAAFGKSALARALAIPSLILVLWW